MRINPVSNAYYTNRHLKTKVLGEVTGTTKPEPVSPSFQGKPLTKIIGGIGALTAILGVTAAGSAALGIGLVYTAVTTAIGYLLDKENEKDEEKY